MIEAVAPWCLVAITAAIALSLVRLFLGPSRADRVVALDSISILGGGAMAALALEQDEPAYTSVALVIALVSFLATVALSFYVRHAAIEEERR